MRLISFILAFAAMAQAQMLSGEALVKALRQGGYVIVMRHASSPREVPDKTTANPDNTKPERQLDVTGRTTATAMGNALRNLKIPIGEVLTSPTYRALETIRMEKWPNPKPVPELGDNGQNMQGGTAGTPKGDVRSEAQASWLQKEVTRFPSSTNKMLVTHLPNLTRAFPKDAAGMEDGEALIFASDGKGGAKVVARIKIEDWSKLPT